MNDLQEFTFKTFPVRTVVKDGTPWFVASDVCNVLGIGNSSDAISRLSESMKGVATTDTLGGSQQARIVNEAGVYKLAFTSRKPEAEAFTDWVAGEVLPSIRKTGAYISAVSPIALFEQMLAIAKQQDADIKQLKGEVQTIRETICDRPDDWRREVNSKLNKAGHSAGGGDKYQELRRWSYDELQERAGCDLDRRLDNMKARALDRIPKKVYDALCYLDVIAGDKKLMEIYWQIVKELAIKYGEAMVAEA